MAKRKFVAEPLPGSGSDVADEDRTVTIKKALDALLSKGKPRSMIVFMEYENTDGRLFAGAASIGSPIDIANLYSAGSDQLSALMKRSINEKGATRH